MGTHDLCKAHPPIKMVHIRRLMNQNSFQWVLGEFLSKPLAVLLGTKDLKLLDFTYSSLVIMYSTLVKSICRSDSIVTWSLPQKSNRLHFFNQFLPFGEDWVQVNTPACSVFHFLKNKVISKRRQEVVDLLTLSRVRFPQRSRYISIGFQDWHQWNNYELWGDVKMPW